MLSKNMPLDFINQISLFVETSKLYVKPMLEILGALWAFNILNWIVGSPLNYLGILPRNFFGLIGIPLSPFLHRNFTHLLFNSIPLFVLGLALLTSDGVIGFCWITLVVTMAGGLGVWLCARPGIHIGASGLISGYFGYILVSAYTQPSVITILIAVLAAYYFGGIFLGIFPGKKDISWEGHLFGFLSGVLCAYLPNLLFYFPQLLQGAT
jgi:membrane associated rhomboid family serine protease